MIPKIEPICSYLGRAPGWRHCLDKTEFVVEIGPSSGAQYLTACRRHWEKVAAYGVDADGRALLLHVSCWEQEKGQPIVWAD
ncbi:MAG: hypothetical protein JWN57_2733 [Frankiales bacterium]|nr:hypothetical protein [Frankiales bacterium]